MSRRRAAQLLYTVYTLALSGGGAALTAGCGADAPVAQAQMALDGSGLSPSQLAAVEVLVLAGADATCARVLADSSPVDDAALDIVAHGRFTVDGTAAHLTIPAHQPLVFYAEGLDEKNERIGRGCTQVTLEPGATPVTITISANQ